MAPSKETAFSRLYRSQLTQERNSLPNWPTPYIELHSFVGLVTFVGSSSSYLISFVTSNQTKARIVFNLRDTISSSSPFSRVASLFLVLPC